VNCAKFSNLDVFVANICKQCLQTPSTPGRRNPGPSVGTRNFAFVSTHFRHHMLHSYS